MIGTVPSALALSMILTVLSAEPTPAAPTASSPRCQKATARRLAALADAARGCMAACRDDAAPGSTRQCSAHSPDGELRRCLQRAQRKARQGIRRACGRTEPPLGDFVRTVLSEETCGNGVLDEGEACDPLRSPTGCEADVACTADCTSCGTPGLCGDGRVSGPERCDESAPPSDDGCPDGLVCTACLYCHPLCGDGQIAGDEVCEPEGTPGGCLAGEECVGCGACGRPVPLVSAEEDISPCRDGVGDRWTFELEAGTVVTMSADTVDAASAAKLAFEGTCTPPPLHEFLRAAAGFPCAFTPPNNPNPGYGCPLWSFVAPATGSCSLTVGVFPKLDVGNGKGCSDPAIARYRLSVGGTTLTLAGDDVPPGLISD